jgi:PAS domain S-box-containing protein
LRFNIGPRLVLCFLLIILSMFAGDVLVLWQFQIAQLQAERLKDYNEELVAVLRVHANLLAFDNTLEVVANDENAGRMVSEAERVTSAFAEDAGRVRKALNSLPSGAQPEPILPELEIIQRTLASQLEEISDLATLGQWSAVRLRIANQVRPLEFLTSALAEKVDHQVSEEQARADLNSRRVQRRVFVVLSITVIFSLLIAGTLGLAITRSITHPLGRLVEGSRMLARGEFKNEVPVDGNDELSHLAQVFNDTARQLQDLYASLQNSEARLRTIIDTIPTIAWCTAPDGSGEFWNQRWHDYTGLSLEAARGWGWQAAIHPEDLGQVTETWLKFLAAGQAGEVEGRLRRFDGEYRWFLFRSCPLRDGAGNIVNWYGTNIDIEDRKRAESLLAGEKRLLEMVAGGHSMSAILDAICQLVESTASGSYCSVVLVDPSGAHLEHGAAPSLPASFTTSIIGQPVDVNSNPCAMAACLNEQVVSADLTSETRWATFEWCPMALAHGLKACWSMPISSTTGKVLGAFAIYYNEPKTPTLLHQRLIEQFTNIASIAIERTQSNSALRRSEEFLAKGQLLSSSGTFSWRVATDEVTSSEQYYRIFGLDPAMPVTFELICSRVHPEDFPSLSKMIERARADGSGFDCEHRLLMPDHSVKYVNMVAHATRGQDGQLEYIGAVQDVTQRHLSEEALSKARSDLARVARVTSLGALTASIAHEVNQPLSGIITNAGTCLRLLAAQPPNIEGAIETARRTIRDGNRASEVITRLRALFTKKDVTTELVDLNEATQEVIALSLRELQRNRVILQPEFADDLPPIAGDRVQLQQVILNLLLNASDAMSSVNDRPRQLVIRTGPDEVDHVRLTVQDAGVGFEPQGVDKLFEAFYTTKSGGMGIGLSVSRSIIESHHGRLWATPNNGPGATFSFSIPRESKVGLRNVRNA